MVKPHSSNFRVITTNVLGVRKLRIITVVVTRVTPENVAVKIGTAAKAAKARKVQNGP